MMTTSSKWTLARIVRRMNMSNNLAQNLWPLPREKEGVRSLLFQNDPKLLSPPPRLRISTPTRVQLHQPSSIMQRLKLLQPIIKTRRLQTPLQIWRVMSQAISQRRILLPLRQRMRIHQTGRKQRRLVRRERAMLTSLLTRIRTFQKKKHDDLRAKILRGLEKDEAAKAKENEVKPAEDNLLKLIRNLEDKIKGPGKDVSPTKTTPVGLPPKPQTAKPKQVVGGGAFANVVMAAAPALQPRVPKIQTKHNLLRNAKLALQANKAKENKEKDKENDKDKEENNPLKIAKIPHHDDLEPFCNQEKNALDDYSIGKAIGKGAYATVRLAQNKKSNIKVALKLYERFILFDAQKRKNVRREIQNLKAMDHPNIMKLHDAILTSRQIILVMEYVSDVSLNMFVKSRATKKLTEDEARKMFRQIVEGIDFCHQRNIIHRDIKMDNIMVDDKRGIKVIDFGFSVCVDPEMKMNLFCGTPNYMAPEIVTKKDYFGPPVDCWALGVLLYTLLHGAYPCLLYTSPSPRDGLLSRMPSSA
eukprot:TRINITY_DN6916_c0_g1_i4.p1 TRINITY_DN6916_c0_g1~~TRINITY_DN6916_c0_g1_i4.p1  ORF type:complete len:529 (+),score=60.02 TRINITY_DN6916_c0_g1_i4:363-1949(+)